jgi:hypothetical protein
MADPEHLEILRQGVEVWNEWRKHNPQIKPDLIKISFINVNLSGINLSFADLNYADLLFTHFQDANLNHAMLQNVDLRRVDLSRASLEYADLTRVDLSGSNLSDANMKGSNLIRADISHALLERSFLTESNLSGASLRGANLRGVNFVGANLRGTNLAGANLRGANIIRAVAGDTIFDGVDLGEVEGLERVIHHGPSEISISTIYLSQGQIPERFLRGCGVPEDFITYARSLTTQPIEFYSCFISYSSKDQGFAERLHADLQSKRVRVWFAPHDMKIGARIRPAIDESIRVHDKLMLVLSEHSVSSQWVEQEVETALRKERQRGGTVLFPVRLDDSVFEIDEGWPALVKDTRHIGDFTNWKNHDDYQKAFDRLLRDLKAGA